MFIGNRLFTYPVLCSDNDDYVNTEFFADIDVNRKGNDIRLDIQIHLDNDGLLDLIDNNEAEYVVHIECSITAYRKIERKNVQNFEISIPINDVKEKVNMVLMIVTKNMIYKYYNPKWNEDYCGRTFDIKKASILAYENKELIIRKNIEELRDASSIFSVGCRAVEGDSTAINIDGHKIIISLPKRQYVIYTSRMKNIETRDLVNSLLIFPALVYVLGLFMVEGAEEEHANKAWYVSLENVFKKRNSSLGDEVLENGAYAVAQDLMENPLTKAFVTLQSIGEQGEEE